MESYLTKILDWKREDIANLYDECPLWSSPFGLLLMEHFPIGHYNRYLDIGCGTGFPLIDISQRLGINCKAYGVDPWHTAINRARIKIQTIGLTNIDLIEADASVLSFPNDYFDLVTSNLGINNFADPLAVISECCRVIKKGSFFCATTNLNGTFQEFYEIFSQTLAELGLSKKYEAQYHAHVHHRGTIDSMRDLFEKAGFKIARQIESTVHMRFLNGSSFLNHSLIIIGFIHPWRNLFDDSDRQTFFKRFENNLNSFSESKGELKLTIPMAYFECIK